MPNLADIQKITATIKEGYKKNFQSDGFGFELQSALQLAGIAFDGQFMAFRRSYLDGNEGVTVEEALSSPNKAYKSKLFDIFIPKHLRAYPKIILNNPNHNLHNQVIGNQTHFWTEVGIDNGKVYCFDNNHPNGIPRHLYYASLKFSMEAFLPELEPEPESDSLLSKRDLSARTVFSDPLHTYKSHEDIVAYDHLLLINASVAESRESLKDEPNWPYYPEKTLVKFSHRFVDEMVLKELKNEHNLVRKDCISKFQAMKNQLNAMKAPPAPPRILSEPQFFQPEDEEHVEVMS